MSEHAYIGVKKCGCVVIERVPIEDARERLCIPCECDEKPAAKTTISGQMELGGE